MQTNFSTLSMKFTSSALPGAGARLFCPRGKIVHLVPPLPKKYDKLDVFCNFSSRIFSPWKITPLVPLVTSSSVRLAPLFGHLVLKPYLVIFESPLPWCPRQLPSLPNVSTGITEATSLYAVYSVMKFKSLAVSALIIFGKKHFLLIPEDEFFHEFNVTELQISYISWTDTRS